MVVYKQAPLLLLYYDNVIVISLFSLYKKRKDSIKGDSLFSTIKISSSVILKLILNCHR